MSSQIDPDPVKKSVRPPAAQPAAAGKPPAKPAGKPAATPPKSAAAAKPATPPKRSEPQKAGAAHEAAPSDPESGADSLGRQAVRQAPAWAVSMLVHVVALLAMALIVNEPPKKETPRVITSNAPEVRIRIARSMALPQRSSG